MAQRVRPVMVVGAIVVIMAMTAWVGPAAAGAPRTPKLTKLWVAHLIGPGSAPVAEGGAVFVTAVTAKPYPQRGMKSDLYAYATTCAPAPASCHRDLLWRHGYPVLYDTGAPVQLSPAGADDGSVFVRWNAVGADSYYGDEQAFNAATGAQVFAAGQGGTSSAVVGGGMVYTDWQFTCCGEEAFRGIEALDATSGAPVFADLFDPTSGPVVGGGDVFAGSGTSLDAFAASGSPCPAPPEPGDELAMDLGFPKACDPVWSGSTGGTVAGTPDLAGGEVVVGGADGVLYAFPEAGCGNPTCAPDWTATVGGSITTAVADDGTTLFVTSSNGDLEAFPVGGCGEAMCAPEWSAAVGGIPTGPAISGGDVYVGSTNDLLQVFPAPGCGAATCAATWRADVHRPLAGAPAVAGGVVFVTDTVHSLYAYRSP
ncbi:MAG TPA: PQQ-binding-like beta-propeller repeat protein [Acidimicrobiales bacterium]|nr:PQQ-binding-like beta-propeller repeat protein [Acidimicrobiales bacterium]